MVFGEFIIILYIFVLAIFVGFELIIKVPPTLHTPLMSGSNAISGITVLGAILVVGSSKNIGNISSILGMVALILATVNVFGGYFVTQRMLNMFKKKTPVQLHSSIKEVVPALVSEKRYKKQGIK